jgi:hypothetical protein
MRDQVWTGKRWVRWDEVTDQDRIDARAVAKALGLTSPL